MSDLTLVIPVKNEKESISIFLTELVKFNFKILTVVDPLDKDTIASIKRFETVEILNQQEPGYGNALIEGVNNTKTKFFCIINADGSMNPKYLGQMLQTCLSKDFVFTSRYTKEGGSDDDDIITFVGNKIFSAIGNIFFNLNISDILFTYILGKTDSFKSLGLKYSDFRICVEIPIKMKNLKMNYEVIPSFERSRIAGKKKVSPFKDGFLILFALIKLFFKKN
jgi:glycosyltransferase involved in cell wall biosynthesis|tara:strand:- start:750 stop:1418 length:669 start_codon:yes stop_codon:yes gene_type:complete